jgi:cobalamin biosynthesis Mg chelatase CobN
MVPQNYWYGITSAINDFLQFAYTSFNFVGYAGASTELGTVTTDQCGNGRNDGLTIWTNFTYHTPESVLVNLKNFINVPSESIFDQTLNMLIGRSSYWANIIEELAEATEKDFNKAAITMMQKQTRRLVSITSSQQENLKQELIELIKDNAAQQHLRILKEQIRASENRVPQQVSQNAIMQNPGTEAQQLPQPNVILSSLDNAPYKNSETQEKRGRPRTSNNVEPTEKTTAKRKRKPSAKKAATEGEEDEQRVAEESEEEAPKRKSRRTKKSKEIEAKRLVCSRKKL